MRVVAMADSRSLNEKYVQNDADNELQSVSSDASDTEDQLQNAGDPVFIETQQKVQTLQKIVIQSAKQLSNLSSEHAKPHSSSKKVVKKAAKLLKSMEKLHDDKVNANNPTTVRRDRLSPALSEKVKNVTAYVVPAVNSVYIGAGFLTAIVEGGFGVAAVSSLGSLAMIGGGIFLLRQVFKSHKMYNQVDSALLQLNQSVRLGLEALSRKYKDEDRKNKLDKLKELIDFQMQKTDISDSEERTQELFKKICYQLIALNMLAQYVVVLPESEIDHVHQSSNHSPLENFNKYNKLLKKARTALVERMVAFNNTHFDGAINIEAIYVDVLHDFSKKHAVDSPERGMFGVFNDIAEGFHALPKSLVAAGQHLASVSSGIIEQGAAGVANAITVSNVMHEYSEHLEEFLKLVPSLDVSAEKVLNASRAINLENIAHTIHDVATAVHDTEHLVEHIAEVTHAVEEVVEQVDEAKEQVAELLNEATELMHEESELSGIRDAVSVAHGRTVVSSIFMPVTAAVTLGSMGLVRGVNERTRKRNELTESIKEGLDRLEDQLDDWQKGVNHHNHIVTKNQKIVTEVQHGILSVSKNFSTLHNAYTDEISEKNQRIQTLNKTVEKKDAKVIELKKHVITCEKIIDQNSQVIDAQAKRILELEQKLQAIQAEASDMLTNVSVNETNSSSYSPTLYNPQ